MVEMNQPDILVDGVGTDVPAILRRFGRAHPVQGYIWQPGILPYVPWTAAQLAKFPAGHFLTATRGGRPEDAEHARELDVERDDAVAADVPPWLIARHEFGHSDGQVYCDLSNLFGVLIEIASSKIWNEPWWSLRIAWYWGRPAAPTLDQVMSAIRATLDSAGGIDLMPAPGRVKLCQWFAGGSYDLNAIYAPIGLTRP